jgi:hypothetical protein
MAVRFAPTPLQADLLTVQQVVEEFGTSKQLVNKLLRNGRLTRYGCRPSRVSRREVAEWRTQVEARRYPSSMMVPGDGDPRHGTENGYGYHKCKCVICRDAQAARVAERKSRHRVLPPGDPKHGTSYARSYYRCDCELCTPHAAGYRPYQQDDGEGE